jgi:hypothetical protein
MVKKSISAIFLLAALGFLAASQPAQALVVTGPEDLIFNFDFTTKTPPPPYTSIVLSFFAIALSPPPRDIAISYPGGGVSTVGISNTLCCAASLGDPTPMIGIFSTRLQVFSGTWDLQQLEATAEVSDQTVTIDALAPPSIPEPSSLVLLSSGLLIILLTKTTWLPRRCGGA